MLNNYVYFVEVTIRGEVGNMKKSYEIDSDTLASPSMLRGFITSKIDDGIRESVFQKIKSVSADIRTYKLVDHGECEGHKEEE